MTPVRGPRGSGRSPGAVPRLLAGRAVGVVGLGQVGGSILRSLSGHRPAIELLGFDRRSDIARSVRRHATWCRSLDDLVARADVVILSLPIQAMAGALRSVARCAAGRRRRGRLLVCDTATVKAAAVDAAERFRDRFDFIGMHPFAGRERNGWEASDPAMFRGSLWVLCAQARRSRAVGRELARLVGAAPVSMDARVHDRIIAETIGLPHALAFAAAGSTRAARRDRGLRGNSWGSLTRVAASDPGMVAGFLHANAANQVGALARLRKNLARLDRALRRPTPRQTLRLLTQWQASSARSRRSGGTS